MNKGTKILFGGLLAATAVWASAQTVSGGQVEGAIFTTLIDGSAVNHNIYEYKHEVYLNGGPRSPNAPCTSAGLPDGDYYFQVTDPSGKHVLSADTLAQRKVHVSGGIISAYLGGTHLTATGKCGSVTVNLYPFHDTPNPGGEYKVWMAPVANFTGFTPSKSKTDNFKAPGDNEMDSDGDGLTNGAELALGTNPFSRDSDNDGVTDGREVTDLETDPLHPDTDGDGESDGIDPCPLDSGNGCVVVQVN
jgi:hypothetical protein